MVYAPVAHWVWGGGWLRKLGRTGLAGGTGRSCQRRSGGAVAALVAGRGRTTRVRPSSAQRSFTLLGAGLLWFGWFGFNAGSALGANASPSLAFANTMLAPMATLVVWTLLDLARTGRATAVGAATAIVVGLVAVTPAAGFVCPFGASSRRLAAFPSYFALLWRARTHSTTRSMSSPRTAWAAPWARC